MKQVQIDSKTLIEVREPDERIRRVCLEKIKEGPMVMVCKYERCLTIKIVK